MRLIHTRLIYTFAFATLAAVLLVRPAAAQGAMAIPLNGEGSKSPEELEKQRQIESDYKATIRKIPDAKVSNDPWGTMRSADTGAQSKPAQPKPKATAPKKTSNAVN
jgi:hypothetical protein